MTETNQEITKRNELARAERAESLAEQWKEASGLVAGGMGGDPDGVTPAAAARYWGEIEGRLIAAETELSRLRECRELTLEPTDPPEIPVIDDSEDEPYGGTRTCIYVYRVTDGEWCVGVCFSGETYAPTAEAALGLAREYQAVLRGAGE